MPLGVRLWPEMLSPRGAWIDIRDQNSFRPETVRLILMDWLTGHGYLRPRENPEGAN